MGGRRGHQADPGVAVLAVVPAEELAAERARLLDRVEAGGEAGLVLERLELRLRVGLSLDVYGPLCVLRTPRSASRNATGFGVFELPRSACTVSVFGSIACCSVAWAISASSSEVAATSSTISARVK
jgi:hypothetical protein